MTNRALNAPLIALSARVYRALLVLYPAEYRREYGWLMAQVFRDVCRESYQQNGALGVMGWWCATLFDLALTAFEQRRKVRFGMSKAALIRMSGLIFMAGGLCGALAAFSQLQPGSHYSYYGVYQLAISLLAPYYLLVGLGGFCVVLYFGEAAKASAIAQAALLGTGIGALITVIGLALTPANEQFWLVFMIGFITHALATLVFGFLHWRAPSVPVSRLLPLAAGVLPLIVLSGVLNNDGSGPNWGLFICLIGMGLVWMLIGYELHLHLRNTVPARVA
jgi:hypothetical protein